jgi:hypothetical protein
MYKKNMNFFLNKPDTCILLHGQVRLSDTPHNSFTEMLDYHKNMCGENSFSMHLWNEDYQKYKEEIEKKHNFIVCNETEPSFSDKEIGAFKQAIINCGCNLDIVDRAVISSTKEAYGVGQSVNKSLEKDYKYFIKTRYDIYYQIKFDINKYKALLDQNCPIVIMPIGDRGYTDSAKGCNNMFYVMNRLAAESLQNYHLSQLEKAKENRIVGLEAGFRDHLKEYNSKSYRINFPVTLKKLLDLNIWYSPDIYNSNYLYEDLL